MKKLTLALICTLISISGFSQCTDLFFSEYIEGSSSNKALEIYNPTGATVDLTNYVIYRYNNGSTTATDSLFPQGTLVAGDVFVIANPSANATILAASDTTHSMTYYNGDDAIALINTTLGDTLDIIGEIGVDPGSGWTVGSGATNNNTLIRQTSIQGGELVWTVSSATNWDVYAIDMVDSLGAHTMTPCASSGCGTNLFFSEYIEGSSSNKALEIYNPTGATVDLTDYVIYRYNNGSPTASDSLFPQGTLADGDVFIIANPSANATILAEADTTHTMTFYNGDDAIAIIDTVLGDTLDIIGIIGVDPGSGWTVGSGATNNSTLVRQASIYDGTTNWTTSVGQWDVFPIDMVDSLGAHYINPCTGPSVPMLSFAGSSMLVNEGDGSFNVTVNISSPDMLVATSVEVTLNTTVSTATTGGTDFTFASPVVVTFPAADSTPQIINIPINDDALVEGDELIVFTLKNPSGTVTYGTDSLVVTLEDNDFPTYPIATVASVDGSGVADSLGVVCRITGVVYGGNLRPSGLQFTLIDPTDGIGVFNFSGVSGYTVTEGDSIAIIGEITQFNGLTQIQPDSIEYFSGGHTLKTPTIVTTLNEATESDLIGMECFWMIDTTQWTGSGSGFNVDITNGADTVVMRIDADVDLYSMPVPTAGKFNLVGIGSQYDSSSPYDDGYQIIPRYSADIVSVPDVVAAFGCDSLGSMMYNFSDSSAGATSWFWDFGDGSTDSTANPSHTYGSTGTYTVTLIASNDCGSDTTTKVIDFLTSNDNDLLAGVKVYPNPSSGLVTLKWADLKGFELTVLNLQGQAVYSNLFNRTSGKQMLDFTMLSKGVYFVKLKNEHEVLVKKLILE